MLRKLFFPTPKMILHEGAVLPSENVSDVDTYAPGGSRNSSYSFSLSTHRPAITNQFATNACTGHGTAGMVGSLLHRLTGRKIAISPWWVWYHGRKAERSEYKDTGVQPVNLFRQGVKAGFVAADKFDVTNKSQPHLVVPPNVEESQIVRFSSFHKLDIADIKQCFQQHLEIEKLPIGLTLKIYGQSWHNAGRSGRYAHQLDARDHNYLHWVYCDGFTAEGAILVNSYGKNWGRGGAVLMPWADLKRLTIEAWSFDPVLL